MRAAVQRRQRRGACGHSTEECFAKRARRGSAKWFGLIGCEARPTPADARVCRIDRRCHVSPSNYWKTSVFPFLAYKAGRAVTVKWKRSRTKQCVHSRWRCGGTERCPDFVTRHIAHSCEVIPHGMFAQHSDGLPEQSLEGRVRATTSTRWRVSFDLVSSCLFPPQHAHARAHDRAPSAAGLVLRHIRRLQCPVV